VANKGSEKVKLSAFPSISSIVEDGRLKSLIDRWSFAFVSAEVKGIAADAKKKIPRGAKPPTKDQLISQIAGRFARLENDLLKQVINGTGVLLHTNLGRSPIDPDSYDDLKAAVCGYSNLEFDISTNKRSKRGVVAGRLIAAIAGADAGMVVNNNASSVFLIVASLAKGKDVIISRGQLVQIGGGFRIPEIIERTGAILKEIGTTNKTNLGDYKKAIGKNTGLILIVHKSNFVQRGFTEEPEPSAIVQLAKKKRIPACYDLGSGLLPFDGSRSYSDEPDIRWAVRTGADLVCFSGDKLLGGPQAGLIVGKKKRISSLLKDPIYRVLRPDKLTIGLLEKTLLGYSAGMTGNLCWRLASVSVDDLKRRAACIAEKISDSDVTAVKLKSSFGGGALPEYTFDSFGLRLSGDAALLSKKLRQFHTPVIVRNAPGHILIDMRTVLPEQDDILIDAIKSCLS
jgi:L-seryl-tRNA(Ser) seleniumtransferase